MTTTVVNSLRGLVSYALGEPAPITAERFDMGVSELEALIRWARSGMTDTELVDTLTLACGWPARDALTLRDVARYLHRGKR